MQPKTSPEPDPSGKAAQQAQFDRRLDRGQITTLEHEAQSARLHQTGAGAARRQGIKRQIKLMDKWLARGKLTVEEHASRTAELRAVLGEEWQPGQPPAAAPARRPYPRAEQDAKRHAALRPPAGFASVPRFFADVRTFLTGLPDPRARSAQAGIFGGNSPVEASLSGAARACGVNERSVRRWLREEKPHHPAQARINLLARWYRLVRRQHP